MGRPPASRPADAYATSRFVILAECRRYIPRSGGTFYGRRTYFLNEFGMWIPVSNGEVTRCRNYFIFDSIEEARRGIFETMDYLRLNRDFQNSRFDEEVWFQIEAIDPKNKRWNDIQRREYEEMKRQCRAMNEDEKGVWYK